jgi:hypothetical protein
MAPVTGLSIDNAGMSWTKKQKSKFKTVIKTVVFKFKTQVVGVFFITLFFILTA